MCSPSLPPPSRAAARSPPEANHGTSIERVRVEVPDVPEGLTVYVKAYLPQADKNGGKGELKLAVEAFGGVAVGKARATERGGGRVHKLPVCLFWIRARIRAAPGQLLRAYFRSKKDKREVYELDPPLLGPQPRILGRSI